MAISPVVVPLSGYVPVGMPSSCKGQLHELGLFPVYGDVSALESGGHPAESAGVRLCIKLLVAVEGLMNSSKTCSAASFYRLECGVSRRGQGVRGRTRRAVECSH